MLRLEAIAKRYPGFSLEVSLEAAEGETLALLGPSGSGKSTVLRIVAGLEAPDSGRVWLGETDLTGLPSERRGVGMVFQDYALFPHLSVAENIAFGPREAGWERGRLAARVGEMLELTRLAPHAAKRPHQLSGGERQRVALARALANPPRVLLMDEPLGALDLKLREELLLELRDLLRATPAPALLVTHDQTEAFALAGRVAVLREGRLAQLETPEGLYRRPKDVWTARFLGHRNLLDVAASQGLGLPARPHVLLPEALWPRPGGDAAVLERVFEGPRVELTLQWRGLRLVWEGPDPGVRAGDAIGLDVNLDRAVAVEP